MAGVVCACGCGQPAPIAPDSDVTRGYVKGQPRPYVHGHNRRKTGTNTYPQLSRQKAPTGTRLVHRLRAEQALGRPLPPRAVVHHVDGSRQSQAPLVILQNQTEHVQLHARLRVYQAGGNPHTEKICPRCQCVLPFEAFSVRRRAYTGRGDYCHPCDMARRA